MKTTVVPGPFAQTLGRRIVQIDERLERIDRSVDMPAVSGLTAGRFVPNAQRQLDVRRGRLLDERAGLVRQLQSELGDA